MLDLTGKAHLLFLKTFSLTSKESFLLEGGQFGSRSGPFGLEILCELKLLAKEKSLNYPVFF